ncbi:hypothetical protein [Blastococcus mobilis]|uniref:Uncharacterized protein n=1 Tax=Blastococcus mobilis TaxID=1938746 RepID=A0A238Z1Z0_9ACTN|nr:hypothetical protein [Blastococcus mobilis]SNR76889.1 hypothetical protein SAMN06272737_12413 [Blastococcus mobilis]
MIPLLIIGLVWLSLTAVMCILIGRAIRNADVHDEEQAQRDWATQGARRLPESVAGGREQSTFCPPALVDPLDLSELSGDPGRRSAGRPRRSSAAVPPAVPRPRRHDGPGRPERPTS